MKREIITDLNSSVVLIDGIGEYLPLTQHDKEVEALRAENEALKIDVAVQLPSYKALREAFMDGVYWYEQSNKVSQTELDKAAHKYANSIIESQAAKD